VSAEILDDFSLLFQLFSSTASILYSVICLLLPTFAIVTINQEWSFDIDFLSITYKPWRFFLVICSLPNFFCALALIFIIPESPKFTYSQGDEEKTLEIFRKIYRINTGKSDDTFPVIFIIKNEEFGGGTKESSQSFFDFMWSQVAPLFKGSHLRNILTACFIQFAVCNTGNGFFTFFPEIMNKVTLWRENQNEPATVCEIFTSISLVSDENVMVTQCVQKLELDTYVHIFETILGYFISYVILSLIINRTGKLALIMFITFTTGTAALLLMFVRLPSISPYFYVYMIFAGISISVVNASTVELFPTKMRAMAVCISMMAGRLGSSVGSLVIGAVIDKHCRETFLMPVFLLFSSGILAITIPNISKRIK
jgi:MFS transporter, VNT family, synaptic vesicle glycoprotein 2